MYFDFGNLLGGLFGGGSSKSGGGFDAQDLFSLLTMATNIYGGIKSYKAQKEAAEVQADAAQEQTRVAGLQEAQAAQQEVAAIEQQRMNERNTIAKQQQQAIEEHNRQREQQQAEGMARAKAAASGVVMDSGSTGAYLTEQERVHASEMDWLKKANMSEIDAMRAQTQYDRQMADMQANQTRINASGTRAQAAQTKAQASQTKAGSYGALMGTANTIWDIGSRSNWYGL